ncbi:uncharacterized protein LOC117582092 [Drosophila guanche]|uniref:uncharacterized protein LOC117582092 n=1 Tax=Drosophila guanche TaxID=7266 RepID=UPI00147204C0|nr:uncharacterized protein LOC117582092 [Drosophila guanche]
MNSISFKKLVFKIWPCAFVQVPLKRSYGCGTLNCFMPGPMMPLSVASVSYCRCVPQSCIVVVSQTYGVVLHKTSSEGRDALGHIELIRFLQNKATQPQEAQLRTHYTNFE